MKHLLTFLLLTTASLTASAQWYFELGVNDSSFDPNTITHTSGAVTELPLHGVDGFRDFSYGVGYLHDFKSFEERLNRTYKWPFVRLGLGAGFDQSNFKVNDVVNGRTYPINYSFAELKAQLELHLTQAITFKKEMHENGNRLPALSLDLRGGIGHSFYTHASQEFEVGQQNALIDLLHYDPNYPNDYPNNYTFYTYGAALQYALNDFTQVYLAYDIDESFDIDEPNPNTSAENYKIVKDVISVGLLIDIKASNAHKKRNAEIIRELQDKLNAIGTPDNSIDLEHFKELERKIRAHQKAIDELRLKHAPDDTSVMMEKSDPIEMTDPIETSVMDLEADIPLTSDFEHVFFSPNSSNLDTTAYESKLIKVARFLRAYPDSRVSLVGYADTSGPEIHNNELSQQRADAVKDYLVETLGASANQIKCYGAGETNMFHATKHKKNRRTAIVLLNK